MKIKEVVAPGDPKGCCERGSDGGFKGDSPLMGVAHPSGHASGR